MLQEPTNTQELGEVYARMEEVLDSNNAVQLATTGSKFSPWILGAYFARQGSSLFLFLEQAGKSIANLHINAQVALSVSQNDAQKDFLQARARAVILQESDEAFVREALVQKMSWYQTYTPVVPVRIDLQEVWVSSFARGWFPGKRLSFESLSIAQTISKV